MTPLRFAFVFLLSLVLGVFFTVPVEDIPQTPYDESESVPFERTPEFSPSVPLPATPEVVRTERTRDPGPTARLAASTQVRAIKSSDCLIGLALLCTLRC